MIKKNYLKNSSGYSLIEVLIASLILSSMILFMMKLVEGVKRDQARIEKRIELVQLSKEMSLILKDNKNCITTFYYVDFPGHQSFKETDQNKVNLEQLEYLTELQPEKGSMVLSVFLDSYASYSIKPNYRLLPERAHQEYTYTHDGISQIIHLYRRFPLKNSIYKGISVESYQLWKGPTDHYERDNLFAKLSLIANFRLGNNDNFPPVQARIPLYFTFDEERPHLVVDCSTSPPNSF